MQFIKSTLAIVLVAFLAGCVKNVPLDNAQAEQIKSTKLIVVKQQKNLEFTKTTPALVFSVDPATMIIGSMVTNAVHKGVFEPRERAALAPINQNLAEFNCEENLSKAMHEMLAQNKHFNFTAPEIVTVNDKSELLALLQNTDANHVAFLQPTYTINRNMYQVMMQLKLSVYNNFDKTKKLNMPKPIYQTSAKYKYDLPKAGWFGHVNNAKRWQAENSKLMLETLNNGIIAMSNDLSAKLEQPFAG